MAGRKPKPSKLKELEGNCSKRPIPKTVEPPASEDCPEPPAHMDRRAKLEWRRVAPALHGMGLLTGVDTTALAAYCQSYSDYVKAQLVLNRDGSTYETETQKGEKVLRLRPEHTVVQDQLRNIKNFCTEFGMTPSSRARLILPSDAAEDDLAELIG